MRTQSTLTSLTVLAAMLSLAPGTRLRAEEDPDDLVAKGFRYVIEGQNLGNGNLAAAKHGQKFDYLVKEFYERLAKDGIAVPITETFLGDRIAAGSGYRVGNTEVWLRKIVPLRQRSIDIIVWELEFGPDGKVKRAVGDGMDHHTVSPLADDRTRKHELHWESKVATAKLWEEHGRRKGVQLTLHMDPSKSFYWRDAASSPALTEYMKQQNRTAMRSLGSQAGRGPFLSSMVPALGGSMAVLNVAEQGSKLLDALKKFYQSPLLTRAIALLAAGEYTQARSYWKQHCGTDQTMHRDCAQLQLAVAEASSLLSARAFTDFPDAMMELFGRWEKSARANANPALLVGTWVGTGYDCNGNQPPQTVRISVAGSKVTAIKVTGDACVPAGQITWEGKLVKDTVIGRMRVSDGPNTTMRWLEGLAVAQVVDRNTLKGVNILYQRKR